MSETLIKVEGLHKKFSSSLKRSMVYGTKDTLRSMAGMSYKQNFLRKGEFWALEDINFELKKGETLGIIGVNGSGKSTLLRLLNGIFPPDAGRIEVNGRIGALIAVGAGFHPHMTGAENIYLNGTILGMTKMEINANYQDIIDFAEIGNFIDAPVATYSSGMRVRLGFSIAIHSHPDILLVDEVLSVGDLSFRNKSLRKLAEIQAQANGIIFISHALEQIKVLCSKLIVLDKGRIVYSGDTYNGLAFYEESYREKNVKQQNKKFQSTIGGYEEAVNIIEIGILNENSEIVDAVDEMQKLRLFVDIDIVEVDKNLFVGFDVVDEGSKTHLIWHYSVDDNVVIENPIKGKMRVVLEIEDHHLAVGIYRISVVVKDAKTHEVFSRVLTDVAFRIESSIPKIEGGVINVGNRKWVIRSL
ncbi:MAG: polysaccharide ABC transporter ATP-binding protein [Bacteroidota bacterium]